jgi:triosephosphate isomerase
MLKIFYKYNYLKMFCGFINLLKGASVMRKPLMAGNWKMNKTISEAVALVNEIKGLTGDVSDVEILVCPPFTSLCAVNEQVKNSNVKLGAQNLFCENSGAYTGEVSGPMLKDAGCTYVIVGHSERRQYFGESNECVNKKTKAALANGLIPIVCVGETLEEREKNETLKVIEAQVKEGLKGLSDAEAGKIVLAYEPVWAIGTGKTATPDQAQEVIAFIRKTYAGLYKTIADQTRILYGGSVKPDNVSEIMKKPDIDGGLVGGASLDAASFVKLIKYSK